MQNIYFCICRTICYAQIYVFAYAKVIYLVQNVKFCICKMCSFVNVYGFAWSSAIFCLEEREFWYWWHTLC